MGYRFIEYLGGQRFKSKVDSAVLARIGVFKQKKDATMLELFCGKGELQEILKEAGYFNVHGSDISEAELRHARKECSLQACNSLSTCYKIGSFDFVFVNEGLHHLVGLDQMKKCFDEVKRILKNNGTFVFYEPANTPARKFLSLMLFSPLINMSKKTKKIKDELFKEIAEYSFWLENTSKAVKLLEEAGFHIETNKNTLMHMVVVSLSKNKNG